MVECNFRNPCRPVRRAEHLPDVRFQGDEIDKLRKAVIDLSKEKFENEKRIIQLEGENRSLKEKVEWLEKDVQAYKTLFERGPVDQKF